MWFDLASTSSWASLIANPLQRANRETTAVLLGGLVLLLAIFLYFWLRLYGGYLLVHDDPANIGGTVEQAPLGWFTRGMADYYHVYPEWPQPGFSNFYRPAWNLFIFAEQAVLGRHYWAWFLTFCLAQYAGALLFQRLLRSLDVPPRPALLFFLLFLFNPAFVNFGFVYPGFQFDIFASLVLLAALHHLLEDRNGFALALIAIAVFMKETTIFAPVAAAVTVLLLRRDIKWSLLMLTPLLAWIAARKLAFHAVTGGTFASPTGLADVLANIGKGLIVWPSGVVPANFPLQLDGVHGMALAALLLGNAVLWFVLIHAGWQAVQALRQSRHQKQSKRLAVLLVWALGALSFCLLTRPQTRFGAALYAFLLLFLACFFFAQPRPGYLRRLAIVILVLVTVLRAGDFLWRAIADVSAERRGERALFAGLAALPQDGRAVLVVNAPIMLSAPRFLPEAWGLRLHVTFINQIRLCPRSGAQMARYDFSPSALSVEIPSCASYVFAGVPDDVQSHAAAQGATRPGIGFYQFSEGRGGIKRLSNGNVDFGRMMRVQLTSPPVTVLALDWQTGAYRPLKQNVGVSH